MKEEVSIVLTTCYLRQVAVMHAYIDMESFSGVQVDAALRQMSLFAYVYLNQSLDDLDHH